MSYFPGLRLDMRPLMVTSEESFWSRSETNCVKSTKPPPLELFSSNRGSNGLLNGLLMDFPIGFQMASKFTTATTLLRTKGHVKGFRIDYSKHRSRQMA